MKLREALALARTKAGRAKLDDAVKAELSRERVALARETGRSRTVVAEHLGVLDGDLPAVWGGGRHPDLEKVLRLVSASLKRGVAAGWARSEGRGGLVTYRRAP